MTKISMSVDLGSERPLLAQTELDVNESQMLTVNVVFLDGNSRRMDLDKGSTVAEIISAAEADDAIEKPEPHTSVVTYNGRALKSDDLLGAIGKEEFTVHLAFIPDADSSANELAAVGYSEERAEELDGTRVEEGEAPATEGDADVGGWTCAEIEKLGYVAMGFAFGVWSGPVALLMALMVVGSNRRLTYGMVFGAVVRMVLRTMETAKIERGHQI